MCVAVRFSSSDYLLAIMARFCVVVVTAVCCIVTGSYGDGDAAGREVWLRAGIYPPGKVNTTALNGRYTQLVTGIAHIG